MGCLIYLEIRLTDFLVFIRTFVTCASQRVKKVIGIELCQEAVEDAKVNAKINGRKPENTVVLLCVCRSLKCFLCNRQE